MKYAILLLTILLSASVALAQATPASPATPATPVAPADTLSGKYEGTVKGSDERVSLELKNNSGKLSGRLQSGQNSYDVTEGTFADKKLSLNFGKQATLTGMVEGDKIAGEWTVGPDKRSIELTRVPAAGGASAAAPANPATAFNLNGEWDAVADANGQPFPFLLVLKVDGENVTGSSSSQLGDATVKSGTWKDGRLVLQIEGQNGTIALTAVVVEGKLSGEFDYAGQLQGKWVAAKKQ